MSIVACSLGCVSFGAPTGNCQNSNIAVNEEISVEFSVPIDIDTVTASSFRVEDALSGFTPPGIYSLDPTNPRRLIYRPKLTTDSGGNPVFGLVKGRSYNIEIPGLNTDAGPDFIRSMGSNPLGSGFRCSVIAGLDPADFNTDPLTVRASVDVITGMDGMGNPILENRLAPNQTNVSKDTQIVFDFNDIMNQATLVNTVSKTSATIRIFIDPDGNITDSSDQVELFGEFTFVPDQEALTTRVVFTPDTSFPSGGALQTTKRRIVVTFSNQIADIAGTPLTTPSISFVPQVLAFAAVTMPRTAGEEFNTRDYEEEPVSGATWGANGCTECSLITGIGGGSGRLGDLLLSAGSILTLYTDGQRPAPVEDSMNPGQIVPGMFQTDMMGAPITYSQLFGPASLVHSTAMGGELEAPIPFGGEDDSQNITTFVIDNYDPGAMELPGSSTFNVEDGIFEFASIVIEPGAVLKFVGANVPRLYARGSIDIRGRIDVSGLDAVQLHDSNSELGGLGAPGGPGGGNGGDGGIRPPAMNDLAALTPIGIGDNPEFMMLSDLDGKSGGGSAQPGGGAVGGGEGGIHWPTDIPTTSNDFTLNSPNPEDDLVLDIITCSVLQVGAPGGGGGHGGSGAAGVPDNITVVLGIPAGGLPPETAAGGRSIAGASLQPEAGFLVGGGGGGGGGASIQGTFTAGMFTFCLAPITLFQPNSSAGGGGGGGAIQVHGGRRISMDGVIDASGGKGGEVDEAETLQDEEGFLAQAGGSGAGGAVLLQGQFVNLSPLPGRIDLSGGLENDGVAGSIGGRGGVGFLQIQELTQAPLSTIAQSVRPLAPEGVPGGLSDYLGTSDFEAINVKGFLGMSHPLTMTPIKYLPGGFTGSQSCWLRPEGNFFRLDFAADSVGSPGWNMKVLVDDGSGGFLETDYRADPSDPNYDQTWEGNYLNGLGAVLGNTTTGEIQLPPTVANPNPVPGAPIVVRFQGARLIKDADPTNVVFPGSGDSLALCGLPLTGVNSAIQPDSLTPWVLHPEELNTYWSLRFPSSPAEVSKRRPNMIRFQIIFNRNLIDGVIPPGNLIPLGVTKLMIGAQPD